MAAGSFPVGVHGAFDFVGLLRMERVKISLIFYGNRVFFIFHHLDIFFVLLGT